MLRNGLTCLLLLVGSLFGACAHAETPSVRLGVFGTLGLTWHSAEHLEYRRSQGQRDGTQGGSLDSGIDSLLGAQMNFRLHDRVDGVVQAISRQSATGSWSPRITWAFARIEPVDSLQLRIGRLGIDATLGADSRLIGYALRTVRPAPELNAIVPMESLDGADLVYLAPIGDDLLRFKVFGGKAEMRFSAQGQEIHLPDVRIFGAQATYIGEHLQLRFARGYGVAMGAGDIQSLIDSLAAIPLPQTTRAAQRLDVDDTRADYTTFDALYDRGPFLAQARIVHFDLPDNHPNLPSQWLGQVLVGYRFGAFAPYVSLSGARTSRRDTRTGLEGLPGLEPLDAAARQAIDGATISQRSLTLGVRYDVRPGLALKFQIDRVHAGRSPVLTHRDDPDNDQRRLTLFSLALDFAY